MQYEPLTSQRLRSALDEAGTTFFVRFVTTHDAVNMKTTKKEVRRLLEIADPQEDFEAVRVGNQIYLSRPY